MKTIHPPGVYVAAAGPMGRGVYAGRDYKKGDVVERCPVVVVPDGQVEILSTTVLDKYVFEWWPARFGPKHLAVVLGYGWLYNHSDAPTLRATRDYKDGLVVFTAVRDVSAGEHLTHNYGYSDPKAYEGFV